jgi:hypothetical protein
VRSGWLVAGFSAELLFMVALAQLKCSLLRGLGARHTLRSVLATAYSSNAISVSVPIIGSAIAAAYACRDFHRAGAGPEHVSVALTVAGVYAAVSVVASVLLAARVTASAAAIQFPRARTWLAGRATAAVGVSRHVV